MTDNGSQAETAQAEARQRAEYQKAFLGKRQQKQNMANQAKAPLQQAQGADKARQARMKNKNYPNSPGQIKKGLNTSNRQVRGKNSSIENKAKNVLAGGSLQAKNKSKSSRVSPSSKKQKNYFEKIIGKLERRFTCSKPGNPTGSHTKYCFRNNRYDQYRNNQRKA